MSIPHSFFDIFILLLTILILLYFTSLEVEVVVSSNYWPVPRGYNLSTTLRKNTTGGSLMVGSTPDSP